jgi:predicted phosphodiesterase
MNNMKLQIFSDLHLDFHHDNGESFIKSMPVKADTAVVAGDLCEASRLPDAMKLLADKWKRIIYVSGNHDSYGSSISETKQIIHSVAPSNFIFLDNERREIDGQWFVGGTMWFRPHKNTERYAHMMNDFRLIKGLMGEVYKENETFLNLTASIKEGDVVVTHHMPHVKSIAPMFKNSGMNIFFLCEVGLEYLGPKLWIHGHTHGPFDYEVTGTRVLCNPLGYPGESMARFDDGLVVEV